MADLSVIKDSFETIPIPRFKGPAPKVVEG